MKKILRFLLRLFGKYIPTDYFARRFPVSVKGIVLSEGRVVLLRNEVGDWDAPGGKAKPGESLNGCLKREIMEELNLKVAVKELRAAWMEHVRQKIHVVVILYACKLEDDMKKFNLSYEHQEMRLFNIQDLQHIRISAQLKAAIEAYANLNDTVPGTL